MKPQCRYLYTCEECNKKYAQFSQLQIHSKQKHNNAKNLFKQRINEQQIYELEDNFFSFLGELSDLYPENSRQTQSEIILEQHRYIGQANYLPNSIVRTPYQAEISVPSQIPEVIELNTYIKEIMPQQQILGIKNQIDTQLKILSEKLALERTKWEFADPHDHTINFDDQFSVLDVVKLVKNFTKRKIVLRLPEISLFLVWIARITKPQMFKLVYEILFNESLCYQVFLKNQAISKSSRANIKNWTKFVTQQKNSIQKKSIQNEEQLDNQCRVRSFQIFLNWKKIEQKNLQKLLSFYESWVQLIMPILYMQKKQHGQCSEDGKKKFQEINENS